MNPTISVIIPTYNRKNIIIDAIKSVLEQEPKNYEVIVVDDGSIDGTEEYVKQFNFSITYLKKENGGVSSARNFGIKNAKGKYIAFLDSDDVWMPGILKAQLEYLESHPNIPLVYCDQYIEVEGRIIPETRSARALLLDENSLQKRFLLPGFVQQMPIHISSVIIRKDIFEELGYFNEDLKIHEDTEMWNRISEKYDLGHIAQPFAIFRWEKDAEHLMKAGYKNKFVEEGRKYLKFYEAFKSKSLNREEEAAIKESYEKIEGIEKGLM